MEEGQTYDVYYDEMGDFLEVTFGSPPENEGTEQIEPGIFITKNTDTGEISAVGILSFKKRHYILKEILQKYNLKFPLKIAFWLIFLNKKWAFPDKLSA